LKLFSFQMARIGTTEKVQKSARSQIKIDNCRRPLIHGHDDAPGSTEEVRCKNAVREALFVINPSVSD